MKWQMPLSSGVSWREPYRTQIPAVTDRRPGICSVKTVMPLESLVERTSSIMYCAIQKLAEITTAPHPSTPESGGKVELKLISGWAAKLDSALFIDGKCPLSNGSGKSPGQNQFAFKTKGAAVLLLVRVQDLGDPFPTFAQNTVALHSFKRRHNVT